MSARRPLARRVLASFAVVVIAFAATVIAGLTAQRSAAQDVAALSLGYLPLETALARARAAQWTVAARLDRLLDDPRAAGTTREWLQTVARGRPAVLAEARDAALHRLGESPDEATRTFGRDVAKEIEAIDRALTDASRAYPDLFGAIEGGDKTKAEAQLRALSARERSGAERLDVLAGRIGDRRQKVVLDSVARDKRANAISIALALLSLIVAAVATREVSMRLAPLGRLTERAKAIAAGDRSPLPEELLATKDQPTDEISELAIAFAAMVEGVATRDADLLRLRRRQEDIVNHLRAAVVALRADGVVEAANPVAVALFDAKLGEPLGKRTPLLWSVVGADVAHAIEKGVEPPPRAGLELAPIDSANGEEGSKASPIVLDLRVVPMRVPEATSLRQGDGRLALLVADDVSEAAAARARAIQAERLAAIGKMAAHITHEIRNPLSSIGLNVELLDETLAAITAARTSASGTQKTDSDRALDEARKLLSAIVREVGRLADVSEEYLRVARLPSPRPSPVDLGELVRDVVVFARPELERARVSVDLRVAEGRLVIPIDEAQVRQALLNLVRNAREAMEDGGTLTLAIVRTDDVVSLEVADEGAGIPDGVRMRIFDPFFTTKSTGTGLGLPLTKQIVEAHGGSIVCTPIKPHGTRFVLTFPLAEKASETQNSEPPEAPLPVAGRLS